MKPETPILGRSLDFPVSLDIEEFLRWGTPIGSPGSGEKTRLIISCIIDVGSVGDL